MSKGPYICPYCGMEYYGDECPYCSEAEYIGDLEIRIRELEKTIRRALFLLEQNKTEDAKKELKRVLRVENE